MNHPELHQKLKITTICQINNSRWLGSDDSLANFNLQLDTCFKYHPEDAQIVIPLKETKKSYRQLCTNEMAAVCPRPLYNIHKFGISSYQPRDQPYYAAGCLRRLHVSTQHFIKLLTTSQDLHESHIRNLKGQPVWLLLQVWTKTWSFYTQNLLLQTSLTRSLGTCQLILISPTGITRIHKRFPARSPTPNI